MLVLEAEPETGAGPADPRRGCDPAACGCWRTSGSAAG